VDLRAVSLAEDGVVASGFNTRQPYFFDHYAPAFQCDLEQECPGPELEGRRTAAAFFSAMMRLAFFS
jgi:hypothetical protein